MATRPRGVRSRNPSWIIGLVDFFDGLRFFADRCRDGVHAHRSAAILLEQRQHDLLVDLIEPVAVHFQQVERGLAPPACDVSVGAHLRVIADAAQQAVGDARRAAAAARDLLGAVVVDRRRPAACAERVDDARAVRRRRRD